jgi:hypothetical protein
MPAVQRAVQRTNLGNLVTTTTQVYSVLTKQSYSLFVDLDVNTPAAVVYASASEIDATANTFTDAAHGLTTGVKGQFTTSVTLPTGISAVTDYFAIVLGGNAVKFATSLANALAGTAVDITDAGTGNQTFTPTALAGLEVKLQKSNKGGVLARGYTYAAADWEDVAGPTAYAADDTFVAEVSNPTYLAACLHITLTAGRVGVVSNYVSRFRDQP